MKMNKEEVINFIINQSLVGNDDPVFIKVDEDLLKVEFMEDGMNCLIIYTQE
jgi:hypothetical protein